MNATLISERRVCSKQTAAVFVRLIAFHSTFAVFYCLDVHGSPRFARKWKAGRCSPPSEESKYKARHCSLHCSFSIPHCSPRSPPQRTSSNWAHPLAPSTMGIPQEHTYHCWMAELLKMQIYASPRVVNRCIDGKLPSFPQKNKNRTLRQPFIWIFEKKKKKLEELLINLHQCWVLFCVFKTLMYCNTSILL